MCIRDRDKSLSGKWFKGPGRRLVNAINEELEGVNVVADDYTSASLLPGVKTVSYTHLDVYKRQAQAQSHQAMSRLKRTLSILSRERMSSS